MEVHEYSTALEISRHLGFPDEVIREISILLEHIGFVAMSAEEQAVFIFELGRLAAERYAQVIAECRDNAAVPPFALTIRQICQMLSVSGE
jgi:hypothetical protein